MPFFCNPLSPQPSKLDDEDEDELEEEAVEAAAEDEAVEEAFHEADDAPAEPFAAYWTATVASAWDVDEAAWSADEPEAEMLAAIFA